MSQIRITKIVREKLDELKKDWGCQTFNEVINLLIEKANKKKWNLK